MHLSEFLTRAQVETLHRNALRVLAEVGVAVEHPGVCARLADVGGDVDSARVRFPATVVEARIAQARKAPFDASVPRVALGCGVYQCRYLDPVSGALRPFDETRLAGYLALAGQVAGSPPWLLGVPFVPDDIPAAFTPLAEKLYAWRYGAQPSGSVQMTGLCEPLLDLFSCHAATQGKRLDEVFGATGYLISPLKLARPECEQLLFFHARGLTMGIGHMPMQGGTTPVTFAGALTLRLAEQIFLYLLRLAFDAHAEFAVGSSLPTVDMRTGAACLGRPEMQRANAAFADIARFYGCACWGHAGLTDAKVPSVEAGAQKSAGTLFTALATGHATVEGGLLGMDEILSPVQLLLDADLARALQALLAPAEIDNALCAVEEIRQVGPGGDFLGTDLTAAHFRELFTPCTWAFQFTEAWREAGSRLDVDLARAQALELGRTVPAENRLSDVEDRALREIIADAVRLGI